MSIRGDRVAIIGGSIAGCAAAIALTRAGCEVTVFERASRQLRDRGSGIAIPGPLRDALVEADYLPASYPNCAYERRLWIHADGSENGRILWNQPSPILTNNWGMLWRGLRERVDPGCYREGVALSDIRDNGSEVSLAFDDGTQGSFDLVIGADGYRSTVRQVLHPDARQAYAGYILWRGNYPEARVADSSVLGEADAIDAWHTVTYPGGHGIMYMIPDWDRPPIVGQRRLNWAIYAPTPAGLDVSQPHAIPPGDIPGSAFDEFDRLLSENFPPDYEALIRASKRDEISIQPIYDERIESYTRGRFALIGDAGSITRPHTGSGATKALQDAMALEAAARHGTAWDDILRRYDEERSDAGAALMEMGRRLGHAQVENTPNWPAMSPRDFESWIQATLAGEELYIYGDEVAAAR